MNQFTTDRLLPRHPSPLPRESIYAYILRLSERNGYSTPARLLARAGFKNHPEFWPGIDVVRIAAISNHEPSELRKIAYSDTGGHRYSIRIGDDEVNPEDIDTHSTKMCPECVAEKGFIEGYWALELMIGCPVHGRKVLFNCPSCGRSLQWFRPGLLICTCGADLSKVRAPSISPQVTDLLQLIWRKIFGPCSATGDFFCRFGPRIEVMSVSSLLASIESFGGARIELDQLPGCDSVGIVCAAARVLADWPHGAHEFLSHLELALTYGRPAYRAAAAELRERFEELYLPFRTRIDGSTFPYWRHCGKTDVFEDFLRRSKQGWPRLLLGEDWQPAT